MKTIKTFPFYKLFDIHTGRTRTVSGAESIDNCLTFLISTCKGELLGDPNFGTNIKKHVMNYKGALLYDLIRRDIVEAISRYEKRVVVTENDISIRGSSKDPNLIYIVVTYLNKSLNKRSQIRLTLNEEDINEYRYI